jgi:hypothetical protein
VNNRTGLLLGYLLAAFAGLPRYSLACSLSGCSNRGVEVGHDLTAVVRLERKPLAGVTVEIHQSNTDSPYFTGLTDVGGKLVILKLAAGDYWISVKYLGISAGYHCFHVLRHSTLRAKSRLNYNWGDYGISMRSVRGNVQQSQPGTGGSPIWNLIHQTTGPIVGAKAQLQNAVTHQVLLSTSDAVGDFDFPAIPEGTYVLHFDGSSMDRGYDPTDWCSRSATPQREVPSP